MPPCNEESDEDDDGNDNEIEDTLGDDTQQQANLVERRIVRPAGPPSKVDTMGTCDFITYIKPRYDEHIYPKPAYEYELYSVGKSTCKRCKKASRSWDASDQSGYGLNICDKSSSFWSAYEQPFFGHYNCKNLSCEQNSFDIPACDRCIFKKRSCDRYTSTTPSWDNSEKPLSDRRKKPSFERYTYDNKLKRCTSNKPSNNRCAFTNLSCDRYDCIKPLCNPLICDIKPPCEMLPHKKSSSNKVSCKSLSCENLGTLKKTSIERVLWKRLSCDRYKYETPPQCDSFANESLLIGPYPVYKKSSSCQQRCLKFTCNRYSCSDVFNRVRVPCYRPSPPTFGEKLMKLGKNILAFCQDPFGHQLIKSMLFCAFGLKLYHDIANHMAPKYCRRRSSMKRLKGC